MENQQHLDLLKQDVQMWNQWREEHSDIIRPNLGMTNLRGTNLRGANLRGADLNKANLSEVDLREADLRESILWGANLTGANLSGANLNKANLEAAHLSRTDLTKVDLREANFSQAELIEAIFSAATFSDVTSFSGANLYKAYLSGAHLENVNLSGADLSHAILREANLTGADLSGSVLVGTDLKGAILTNCRVYGISVWDVLLEDINQLNLVITPQNQATITVDNLEVAQFIYLLLNNPKIRDVIDTIGQKGVLILGRFSDERKPVLNALREKLRTLNYVPMVFDFKRPTERDFTETIMTLAGLCRFIIADITNPRSSPLELQAIVPNYMIPFVPILQEGEQPFAMFKDLHEKYNWVLDLLVYDTPSNLIQGLERAVVEPALVKHKELMIKKMEQLPVRHIGDYV